MTIDIARSVSRTIDIEGFEKAMEKQREMARKAFLAISLCFSIAFSKPSISIVLETLLAISIVMSNGKPYVSYNLNANSPANLHSSYMTHTVFHWT